MKVAKVKIQNRFLISFYFFFFANSKASVSKYRSVSTCFVRMCLKNYVKNRFIRQNRRDTRR